MSLQAEALMLAGVGTLAALAVPLQLAVPVLVLVVCAGFWLIERGERW
jgi:hypothetical protein